MGDVDTFILENGLDERAGAALRDCTPEVQAAVMAEGDLNGTTNPSGSLMGRLRKAQSGQNRRPSGLIPPKAAVAPQNQAVPAMMQQMMAQMMGQRSGVTPPKAGVSGGIIRPGPVARKVTAPAAYIPGRGIS